MNMILSKNAIRYVIKNLMNVAFPECEFEFTDNNSITFNGIKIEFGMMNSTKYNDLFKGMLKLNSIKSICNNYELPIYIEDGQDFASVNKNDVFINADIITIPFILLSRYEELVYKDRDKHGRFSYNDSILCKYEMIGKPIVDEYAMLLRNLIIGICPELEIKKNIGKIITTHDVDRIRRFNGLYISLRTIFVGDLLIRKNIKMFITSIKQYLKSIKNKEYDPEIIALRKLIDNSKKYSLTSVFYFMGYDKSDKDATYYISDEVLHKLFKEIEDSNITIGFHGGLNSCSDKEKFSRQKNNLQKSANKIITANRQHYLCFDINNTINVWNECGVQTDSTLCFHDHEGFRCGTCHKYNIFDIVNDSELQMEEQPLIAMDVTLKDYRKLSETDAYKNIDELYNICKNVEGDFTVLWHSSNMFREWESWYREVFEKFLINNLAVRTFEEYRN